MFKFSNSGGQKVLAMSRRGGGLAAKNLDASWGKERKIWILDFLESLGKIKRICMKIVHVNN